MISATDTALRANLTEPRVHVPCGGIRGPLQTPNRAWTHLPVPWQSCRDEDEPEEWEGVDVSRQIDLCIVCFRATAGGISRWARLACANCWEVNESVGARWGFRPFPLGRHSIMNGIAVRNGLSEEERAAATWRLAEFARGDTDLRAWRVSEYRRLAARYDPLADVPLADWQRDWPPSKEASVDAFARLLGD